MKAKEASKLKIGSRVLWNNDPNDAGTVIDTRYCCVTVQWDNGLTGTLHVNDCEQVSIP